jgi:serine protease Do
VVKILKIFSLIITLIVILVSAGCSLPGLNIITRGTTTPAAPPNTTLAPINPTYSSPPLATDPVVSNIGDFSQVIANVRPSVVSINTEVKGTSIFGGSFTQEGSGSGWIIDSGGLIVTNNHVIQDATSVSVSLEDGRNFPAETIRADSVSDLAVLKINASNLPPALKIGDSSRLKVGNWVIAIGNSLGEGISATKGIVSALGVSVTGDTGETLYDLIQTDAAINPGNSGGPLVNTAGEVVGINSIKVAQVGVEGMGYAISTKVAMPIINELIKNGFVSRPWLGVSGLYTVDPTVVRQLGLAVNKGVVIDRTIAGGPASQAGLKQYDVITRINDKEITTSEELVVTVRSYKVGDVIQVTYWRDNTNNTVSLTLTQRPSS